MNKKAIAIDGNSLLYRCYYATYQTIDYYKKNNTIPMNGLKLFLSTILKLIENNNFDYALIAFDAKRQTFRNEMMQEYKANRSKTPEDLIVQIPLVQEVLNDLEIKYMVKDNYEADDLIGSFSKLCEENNCECEIYSSDKDLLQLVTKTSSVNLLKTGITKIVRFDIDNFSSLFNNLTPSQIIDYKALVGDGSDNFCGIKGIGEKTAIELLNKYQTLDNIYEKIEELKPSIREKFLINKQNGALCKKIATIQLDLLHETQITDYILKPIQIEKIRKIANKYHFKRGFEKYF